MAEVTGVRRQVRRGHAAWMAVVIAAYFAFPGLRIETWGLISAGGAAAVVAGALANKPARRAPWLVLAASLASFAAGQVSFLIAGRLGITLPFPSFADGLYLAEYPLWAAGLLLFITARTPLQGDRRALVDAMTLTAGAALLSWSFMIRPHVYSAGLTALQRSVTIAYPLGDLLVLALLLRMVTGGTGGAPRSIKLLSLGTAGCLLSDTAWGVIQLHGTFHNGTPVDLGWALLYSCWGAAALQPDMARLTDPVPSQRPAPSPGRLALLMLVSLIAPGVMLTAPPGGLTSDLSVVAGFSAVLYLLVLFRLWDSAASQRRVLERERVMQSGSTSLAAAAGEDQVAAAVEAVVAALLGPRSRGSALLGVWDNGSLRPAASAGAWRGQDLAALTRSWQAAERDAPVLMSMKGLPGPARAARPAARWVLLCPLAVGDAAPGKPVGVIAAFGQRRSLASLAATLEILAHQAALALHSAVLRQEAARFRTVVQDASDAVVIVSETGMVKYSTPSAAAVLGRAPKEGSLLWDLAAGGTDENAARMFRTFQAGSETTELQIIRPDGSSSRIQAQCSDLSADRAVGGLVLTLRDVTEQHELTEQLRYRALYDALTGLPNRALLQDRVGQQAAVAARSGTIAGVLIIDLDIQLVSGVLGRDAGDKLLVAAAERLVTLIRASDTAARLEGSKFALLIGGATRDSAVEAAARRVVDAFTEPFLLDGRSVSAPVTVGVATTFDGSGTVELLRHAGLALHAAKAAGDSQWRRYQPFPGVGVPQAGELRQALAVTSGKGEFALAYQPVIALRTGAIAGFEALLRWSHPRWGTLLPGQFIGLAEESGQIIPIGAWVLAAAVADITRWRQQQATAGPPRPDLYVSVNVSSRQLADPGFPAAVKRVLDETELEPGALMLELAESSLDGGLQVSEALQALKAVGVRLAVDNFGTGHLSLSYLRTLPVDVVKMDRSLVSDLSYDHRQLIVAEGLISLAAELDFQVIAGGVESPAQRDLLTSLGCRYGQGYLLALPMTPSLAAEAARTGTAEQTKN